MIRMPAIIMHLLFGEDVLHSVDFKPEYQDVYDWGTQGPDFLFFALPINAQYRRLNAVGSSMHRTDIEKNLSLMADCCSHAEGKRKAVLTSYFYGYLAHYILDRTFHPYVFALQRAFKALLPEAPDGYLHKKIETNLDVIFLDRLSGQTVKTYAVYKKLKISPELQCVCSLYSELFYRNYGIGIPRESIRGAFSHMKLVYNILYSPKGVKRGILAAAERFSGHPYPQIAALSHTPEYTGEIDYANVNKAVEIESSGEALTCSAFELYEKAKALYAQAADIFKNGGDFADITGGINFEGRPVDPKR